MGNKYPSLEPAVPGATAIQQAQQIWMILVSFVMAGIEFLDSQKTVRNCCLMPPATLTYGDLALKMGYDDKKAGRSLGHPLGILAVLCINSGLPAINTLVVNQVTGKPGESVLYHGDLETEQRIVFENREWFSYRIPTLEELEVASAQIPEKVKKQISQ